MTTSNKRDWLFRRYANSLGDSKFAQVDLSDYARFLSTKTTAEIGEMYERQRAIANVSQREINENCQFNGLPKL